MVASRSDEIQRHNEAYERGCELSKGELILSGREAGGPAGWWLRRKLRRAAAAFDEALSINPGNWAAEWLVGKIHQRLAEHSEALRRFARAHELQPGNANVAREATIAAIQCGNGEDAIRYSEAALALAPEDGGLMANHALALLVAGRLEAALGAIDDALARSPDDHISRSVREVVLEVMSGRRPQPKSGRDLG